MRLVAYLRVSSESQIDGFGLVTQEEAITAWAHRHGHEVVQMCKDEGVPGTTDAIDREGLTCALDAITVGDADGLVVARLDRLARALTTQEAILAAIWRLDASVFSADHGEVRPDDPDDPMRTAMRQMAGVFAQLDRSLTVKRLRDGRRAKAAAGGHSSGPYPYGWRGHNRQAIPVPHEQQVIRRIHDLRAEGRSYREIATALDAGAIPTRGGGHWNAMSVRAVCQRSVTTA